MNKKFILDNILVAISYLASFLPSVLFLYFPFLKEIKKEKRFQFYLGAVVLEVALLIVAFLFFRNTGMSDLMYKLNSGFFYFAFLFWLLLFCKHKKTAILFNFGCVGIVILSISGVVSYIADHFPMKYVYLEMYLFYFGIMLIVSVPFCFYLRHNTRMLSSIVEGGDWTDIWFLPFSIMVVCAFTAPLESHVSNIYDVLGRLVCGIFAIYISQHLSHSREVQKEKGRLLTELSSQKEYYKEISRTIREERRVRHDFRHAVLAIRSYIDEDDKDGLKNYCEKLLDNSVIRSDISFLGNSVADGILYRYTLLCEENNVKIESSGALTEDIIDDMDMCVLLGNAMENALEACQRMKADNKWIRVKIEESPLLLSIAISNSYEGEIEKRKDAILSSKRKHEKGIGLQSMRMICEKYNGAMHVTYDDVEFHIMLLLNVNKDEKKDEK